MVAHAHLGHIVEIYIAEDTAHAEHVLTLQVGAVAPTEYLNREFVFAFTQVLGQVELSNVVGTLGVAYVFAIEPYEGSRVDTAEVDKGALAVPAFRDGEGAYV